MSVGSLVLVFTSIVDTVPLPGTIGPGASKPLVTKAVLPSGVTATPIGRGPTGMSVGFLVLVFTSIVDTVPLSLLATKAVLPSGVTATPTGIVPTAMSVGFLVLVFTSIVDTESLPVLVTKAVARHRERAGTADTPSGTTPTSAPANPNTKTLRTHRNRASLLPRSPPHAARTAYSKEARRRWPRPRACGSL